MNSLFDSLFHKKNIHELNCIAQFANFRKKYKFYIETNDLSHYGKEFGILIDKVEKEVLQICRTPNGVSDDVDYYNAVIDKIMLALLDEVGCGDYLYGKPLRDTMYFAELYLKILEDEFEEGRINEEERKTAKENLAFEIRNNR